MKIIETHLRKLANKQGFILKKSRAKKTYPENIDNYGGYQLISAYDFTLDDVIRFLELSNKNRKEL